MISSPGYFEQYPWYPTFVTLWILNTACHLCKLHIVLWKLVQDPYNLNAVSDITTLV